MNHFIRIFNTLALLFIILLANCAQGIEDNPPKTYEAPSFNILADEHLSEGHKAAILAAIDEWTVKTNYTIKYTIQFVDMSQQPKDLETKHTIRVYIQDPGPGFIGWTEWVIGNQSAYTLMDPGLTDDEFRMVMLHELGHAFDLHFDGDTHYHGNYESVMHPAVDSEHLGCVDLEAFCANYGCQIDCTPKLQQQDLIKQSIINGIIKRSNSSP